MAGDTVVCAGIALRCAIAYAILTTGRSTLITIAVGSTCVYLLKHRTAKVRNILFVRDLRWTLAGLTALVFVMKDSVAL